MSKMKLQNEKQIRLNAKRPPGERMSVLGNKYPLSSDGDWRLLKGAGHLHKDELGDFSYYFKQCVVSGLWFENKLVRCVNASGNLISPYIETAQLSDPSCLYAEDVYNGYVFKKSEMIEVLSEESKPILVSKKTRDSRFLRCDISKKFYPSDTVVSVRKNVQGIYRVFQDRLNDENPQVRYCRCCNGAFVNTMVSILHAVPRYEGTYLCQQCIGDLKNKGLIQPHNYKASFNYLYTPRLNMIGGYQETMPEPRLFGVEVETEFSRELLISGRFDRFDVARETLAVMPPGSCVIKEDGSLVMNGKYTGDVAFDPEGKKNGKLYAGFEIVSAPCDLDYHRLAWPCLLKSKHHVHMRAWDTETCGLHIHVSRKRMSTLQIGRILAFVNHPVNRQFIRRMAGRAANKYAILRDKRISSSLTPESGDRDSARRVAVNVQNEHTIEFRIFRGTVRPCHIIRNIEFVDALCDYCSPAGRSFRDLFDPMLFMQFCLGQKKSWPIMASWLVDSGLINDPKMTNKSDHYKRVKYEVEDQLAIGPLPKVASLWDAIGLKGKSLASTDIISPDWHIPPPAEDREALADIIQREDEEREEEEDARF